MLWQPAYAMLNNDPVAVTIARKRMVQGVYHHSCSVFRSPQANKDGDVVKRLAIVLPEQQLPDAEEEQSEETRPLYHAGFLCNASAA